MIAANYAPVIPMKMGIQKNNYKTDGKPGIPDFQGLVILNLFQDPYVSYNRTVSIRRVDSETSSE